jgi:hypothetical protein
MAIEINDKGILVAAFALAPDSVGEDLQWRLFGRGVTGISVGPGGEALVVLEEELATVPPQHPADEVTYLLEATCTGSTGYPVATAVSNVAGDALGRVSVQTFQGSDVLTGAPVIVPQACFVLVYRLPLPFVAEAV